MRLLITATVIFIVMAAALAIYLEIGNRHFESSLPKPEIISTETSDIEKLANQMTGESLDSSAVGSDFLLDNEASYDIEIENINDEYGAMETTSDSSPNSELDLFEQYIEDIEDEFDVSEDDIEKSTFVQEHTDQEDYLYHTSSGRPDAIYSMSLAEQETELARRRQRLIEDFGDTPEVRLISKHFYSRVIPRGASVTFQGNEGVEILRALSVLWPTESNMATYESLKLMQEKGWHR